MKSHEIDTLFRLGADDFKKKVGIHPGDVAVEP